MSDSDSFAEFADRLRGGDDQAAEADFIRFTGRLNAFGAKVEERLLRELNLAGVVFPAVLLLKLGGSERELFARVGLCDV